VGNFDDMNLRKLSLWIVLFLVTVTLQCTADPPVQPRPTTPGNLLVNGSFENGREPWFALVTEHWGGFSVTERYAVEGRHSAHLALRAGTPVQGTNIVGLVQELSPAKFPRRLSGFYRIEGWTRGTPKQYLQVVVIVSGNPNEKPFPNYQIRYVLAGIEKPPLQIVNARYLLLGGSEIREGRWIRFDIDLHSDFQRHWGRIPTEFSKIRVLFEVRCDEKKAGDGDARADVYYDDLYLGE
jgi:hypothetical protein